MWASGYYGYLSDYLLLWAIWVSLVAHAWCFFRLFPRHKRHKLSLVVGNALVACCLAGFAGMIAESYLRFVSTATDAYGATLTCRRWHVAYAPTNSLGHRDLEWSEAKPLGVKRVAFVGDSFTYGWGINRPEDRFSNLIQTRFEAVDPGSVEVMNVAWRGWDARAQVAGIERMIREYGADEVVLCYVPNDIEGVLPTRPDFDPKKPPQSTWLRTDCSFLLDYLYYRVYAPRVAQVAGYCDWLAEGFLNESTWKEHQADLGRIIALCREHQVPLRVALLPFLQTTGTKFQAGGIHAMLTEFFRRNEVPVVDLRPCIQGYMPKDLAVNAHDYHPNELANRLFADCIWKAFFVGSR